MSNTMKGFTRIAILVSMAFLMLACDSVEKIESKPTRVKIYTLPSADHQVLREFNGVARAQDLTALSFRLEGRIAKIPAAKGQMIKKGDLLAVLEKRDFKIALDDRRARLEVAGKQAARIKQLIDKKLIAQSEFDKVNAQYLVAQAQEKQAELNLRYTELHAPFDGMISDVFVEPFENAQPGKPVLSVQRVGQVEVDIQIPDMILAVSHQNDTEDVLKVSFEMFEDVFFEGRFLEINTEKDAKTSTYIATVAVDLDGDYKVLEGMPAKVQVNLSNITYTYTREFLLPINAVVMKDGDALAQQKSGVWLYDFNSQTVKYQAVRLGVIVGDKIEIIEGLKDGQTIVTLGASKLIEGQRVELVKG